ncbi:stage V sporulation protein D [Hathewaya histolytica]|uniref:Stage V sporulation protein D n=1 Tax=Hathewaya histolytica TaxID=1498 RepID=A0A4U9R8J6_HATHI|nr:stage V sporulation protein D [Hathewaya histolytica]VTQ87874.1 stage V sporulation protein D [Hathewaya histolytica]
MNRKYRDKVTIKKRGVWAFLILFSILFTLGIRVLYIMTLKSGDLKEKAVNQWTSEVKIAPKRGKILDRNNHELAVSANVYRIDVDLNALRADLKKKKVNMESLMPDLSGLLDVDEGTLKKKMIDPLPNGKPKGGAMLKRRMESDETEKVKEYLKQKDYYGFIISPDTKRYYPNNNFLSHVIGNTNSDGTGLMGVEQIYDRYLAGIPGIKISELDKNRQDMPYVIADYIKPVDGKNVVLSIDENIQYFAEKAAEQALKDNKAKAVSVLVMNPNNGEILGMANKPDYNPNKPFDNNKSLEENQRMWRNRAVSDTFEPGSIFKVVTSTAALSEGKVTKNDKFVCNGSVKIGNRTIHCWKRTGHGAQDFAHILQNSCNVGFMELGRRLGAETLTKYIKLFGFGQKTGIDLNGEAAGIVKNAKNVTETDLATISFGQTNTVSPIQFLTAFNAIANGGKLITPHVMKEITHYDADNNMVVDTEYKDKKEKKIIDEDVARELRGYLEKVISEGGGKKAFIQGYHIGGKTGTAQKIAEGGKGYAQQKYIASFVGMAPSDNPQVTLLVSIDEPDPSNYYAGQIATPVAKQVFNDIFNYLSFKTDANGDEKAKSLLKDVVIPEVRGKEKEQGLKIIKDSKLKVRIEGDGKYINDINPKPGSSVKEGTEIIIYTSNKNTSDKTVVVPNLNGLSVEQAKNILGDLGLKFKFSGDGMISTQSIKEGERVQKGTMINLRLEIIGD